MKLLKGMIYSIVVLILIKSIALHGSIIRTVLYTIGHILIAITCNWLITGADWGLATIDALVEPLINSLWYFTLDYYWATKRRIK
jgi:uncharacterized membrane protein